MTNPPLPRDYTLLPPVSRRALLRLAAADGIAPATLWTAVLALVEADGLAVEPLP